MAKNNESVAQAHRYLTDMVPHAPEPMNHHKMFELGLNMMIGVGASEGCDSYAALPVEQRVAAVMSGLHHGFDNAELRCLLACAVDRLTELALNGASAYRFDGEPMPDPIKPDPIKPEPMP